MIGLVGVHKWLLGDATTWRKETLLGLWLFFALLYTWDPVVRVAKGQASASLVFWLALGWLYFAIIAAPMAVPAIGRVVGHVNPVLLVSVMVSPAVVIGVHRAVRHFANRNHEGPGGR